MILEIVSIVSAAYSIVSGITGSKKKIRKKKRQLEELYRQELEAFHEYESELKEIISGHRDITLAEMRKENELAFEERKEFRKQLERLS